MQQPEVVAWDVPSHDIGSDWVAGEDTSGHAIRIGRRDTVVDLFRDDLADDRVLYGDRVGMGPTTWLGDVVVVPFVASGPSALVRDGLAVARIDHDAVEVLGIADHEALADAACATDRLMCEYSRRTYGHAHSGPVIAYRVWRIGAVLYTVSAYGIRAFELVPGLPPVGVVSP